MKVIEMQPISVGYKRFDKQQRNVDTQYNFLQIIHAKLSREGEE